MPLNEANTRAQLIDPALEHDGWDLDDQGQVSFEIPVDDVSPGAWQAHQGKLKRLGEQGVPLEAELPAGITDFALYRENGEILAVVEAKRTRLCENSSVPILEGAVRT